MSQSWGESHLTEATAQAKAEGAPSGVSRSDIHISKVIKFNF